MAIVLLGDAHSSLFSSCFRGGYLASLRHIRVLCLPLYWGFDCGCLLADMACLGMSYLP